MCLKKKVVKYLAVGIETINFILFVEVKLHFQSLASERKWYKKFFRLN